MLHHGSSSALLSSHRRAAAFPARPVALRPLLAPAPLRRAAVAPRPAAAPLRAQNDDKPKPGAPGSPNDPEGQQDGKKKDPQEVVLAQLKATGLTPTKAREMLKKWEEMGVKDPEELRKLLINRSLQPAFSLGTQALLDFVAAVGAYVGGKYIGGLESFPGQIVFELIAYFGSAYYALNMLLNLSIVTTVLLTGYKYGANSSSILVAVQSMAGPSSGLVALDNARVAVNTLKVLQVLNSIAELLQETAAMNTNRSTLQNLSAYLTLAYAKEKFGFDPAAYNLTEGEAGEIAYVFSLYDSNDDYRLDTSELGRLCSALGKELSEPELKEALRVLDTSKNGYIEFGEFVDWWQKKSTAAAAAAGAAGALGAAAEPAKASSSA